MLRTKTLYGAASLLLAAGGPAVACPWDCGDGDGTVGIVDVLGLLADWGQPGTCDFDGGDTGITDFLLLLANWGPCTVHHQIELLAHNGGAFDFFGATVGISGGKAVVGAYGYDLPGGHDGEFAGSAYLFNAKTGIELAELRPDDAQAFDQFGQAVAIGGPRTKKIAIVGSINGGDSNYGAAYLFNATTGEQIHRLMANEGTPGSSFGGAVALSPHRPLVSSPTAAFVRRTIAIVGARNGLSNGALTGLAYLFDTTTGEQIATLVPDDGGSSELFGQSVAISRTTAIVGALHGNDGIDGSNNFPGATYVFNASTGEQIAKLLADDGENDGHFGLAVAIRGSIAIIGARNSAYLFDITTGQQITKLVPHDNEEGDAFGASIAISGTTAILGAPGDGNGSAYLFDISDPTHPVQVRKLAANDGAPGDLFGWSVSITGTATKKTAIGGAWRHDDNGTDSGAAYLFKLGRW